MYVCIYVNQGQTVHSGRIILQKWVAKARRIMTMVTMTSNWLGFAWLCLTTHSFYTVYIPRLDKPEPFEFCNKSI